MTTKRSLLVKALKKSSQPEVSAVLRKVLAAPDITDYQAMARKDIHKMKDVLQKLGDRVEVYLKKVPLTEAGASFERDNLKKLHDFLYHIGGACGILGDGENDNLALHALQDAMDSIDA
jgi:hypothetical protein